MKTKGELMEEYNKLNIRLNNAEKYFETMENYNPDTIEQTKEYKALESILKRLNELHYIIYITKEYKEEIEEGCF